MFYKIVTISDNKILFIINKEKIILLFVAGKSFSRPESARGRIIQVYVISLICKCKQHPSEFKIKT